MSLIAVGLRAHRIALLRDFQRGTATVGRVDSTITGINTAAGFAAGITWLVWQHFRRTHSE